MAFGQLTHRESLSDTVLCLNANSKKLYHLGIGKTICKTTLSRANENRDWRIYQEFALLLVNEAKELYKGYNQLEVNIENDVFAIDSSTIDLCLSVYPWAKFRKKKAAVKLHTMIDAKTSIPEFIYISDGKMHDVNVLDLITTVPNSFYVMDKAYIDFARLYLIHQNKAFFISRKKNRFAYERVYSAKVDKKKGVLCDQIIKLTGFYTSKKYPKKLRRIKYYDAIKGKKLEFVTNNFRLSALEIALLYKHRWYIEIFFKWIKQHLKIKSFWGTSPNAVKTQIWISISVYLIVLILKKRAGIEQSIYEILQILSINMFDREPIYQLFTKPDLQNFKEPDCKQLTIFDL
jgi:hypothetical protein